MIVIYGENISYTIYKWNSKNNCFLNTKPSFKKYNNRKEINSLMLIDPRFTTTLIKKFSKKFPFIFGT